MATVALSYGHFQPTPPAHWMALRSQPLENNPEVSANRLKISVSASQPLEKDLGLQANRL